MCNKLWKNTVISAKMIVLRKGGRILKKLLSLVLVLLFITGIFSSCSSEPVGLFFAVEKKAGSFDPQIVSDDTASIVVRNCYEGLVRNDENGGIINGVAKSHTVSADGLTYTFYLREDAKWHLTSNAQKQLEGKLPEDFDLGVTAYDFQFALRRAVDPATGAENAFMLRNIENAREILNGNMSPESLGVTVKDKYTLEIKLSIPQSNFTDVLTEPLCMPCNEIFFEACSGRYGTLIAFTLSNGPFYLSRFDDTSYRINKSDDYCGESTAVPDYVWLYVVDDEEKLLEVLRTDDYSGAVISDSTFGKLRITKNMTVKETPDILGSFIMNPSDSVLCENDIRLAISAATDTDKVASFVSRTPAEGMVPICASNGSLSHPKLYNEENASVYLKQGLKNLGTDKISISLLCESKYEGAMKRLLQEWQRILGISVTFTVKTATPGEIETALSSGSFQIVFYPVAAKSDSAYKYFGSLPLSVYGVKDIPPAEEGEPENIPDDTPAVNDVTAEYICSLLDSLHSSDEAHYSEAYHELENRIAAASVILPLWNENSYFVCTKNVKGVIWFSSKDSLYFHNATNVK